MTSRFIISIDVELLWGMFDLPQTSSLKAAVIGGRASIPVMLKMFHQYNISATWAFVGMMAFRNKCEIIESLPQYKPLYHNQSINSYHHLRTIGENEKDDPLHFGRSLLDLIASYEDQELASHTFSHFYCMEPQSNPGSFSDDLRASISVVESFDRSARSLIFCRNQYTDFHLDLAYQAGFTHFRGNRSEWIYRPSPGSKNGLFRRAVRYADSFISLYPACRDVQKSHILTNVQASMFFRASERGLLRYLHVSKIKKGMEYAAKRGLDFHLWWHPHNFGANLSDSLLSLEEILKHFQFLTDKYGMQSTPMADVIV